MNQAIFWFEKLDVYQRSIEFLALAHQIIEALPKGHAVLADQLRRAALSVSLNIAEGAVRTGTSDTERHRAIARGSAMECAAILDACRVLVLVDERRLKDARALLLRIVQMLSKLCR